MKHILITDMHFDLRNGSTFFINNYKKFYSQIFFPYIKKHSITSILIGGDTFENRRTITVNGLTESRKMFFDPAEQMNISIKMILGNHDVAFRNTNEVNSIDIINKAYNNIHLIEDYEEFVLGKYTIGMLSWINSQNYKQKLAHIESSKADILFGHLELNGFQMVAGQECTNGMNPDIFSKFQQVWSGHFHIRSNKGNITYLGNPSQTNWGDCGYKRGFHVFDDQTGELEFIENTFNVYEKFEYDDSINIETFDYPYYKDKIVSVNITSLIDINTKKFNIFIENLQEHTADFSINQTAMYHEDGSMEVDDDHLTTQEIIHHYIDSTLDGDKESILELMNELYTDALNANEIF